MTMRICSTTTNNEPLTTQNPRARKRYFRHKKNQLGILLTICMEPLYPILQNNTPLLAHALACKRKPEQRRLPYPLGRVVSTVPRIPALAFAAPQKKCHPCQQPTPHFPFPKSASRRFGTTVHGFPSHPSSPTLEPFHSFRIANSTRNIPCQTQHRPAAYRRRQCKAAVTNSV
ncbi:uncharacterized protein K452DRAFT_38372 [Aplosporella prunicola CBS 121167]|uniref:Uncharacterized protein n=1 Tax=Aplosporella prunicola CBS 121167 TaxID=1176127 RepID=A0A6A6BDN8_9PEZI|nr:uncharacterized protein K452DRAFT_38372 [Aplosporella prunicola CBS 121167]KAF2141354.1 hypothetical protein K452DRAFT_38372 [Aplosporella prunicola CBS 121167]